MKRLLATAIALSTLGALPAAANEVLIEQCVIRKVEKLGISPDLAYTSCQRASIVDCIKSLRGSVSTIASVKKVDGGYFYDLGSDKKTMARRCLLESKRMHCNQERTENY